MQVFSVMFLPDNKKTHIREDENVFQAALKSGITLNNACGGKGVCKQCKILIKKGRIKVSAAGSFNEDDQNQDYVLACKAYPESALVVEIPEASKLKAPQINLLSENIVCDNQKQWVPLYQKVHLQLPEPNLNDPEDDLGRLLRCMRKETGIVHLYPDPDVLCALPKILRDSGWEVDVFLSAFREQPAIEISAVEPANHTKKYYGLAVDIGTTTVVAHLVNLENRRTVGVKGTFNRQAVFGSDVITRIIYAGEYRDGLDKLQKAVIDTINNLIEELAGDEKINPTAIKVVACAGNTAMIHLFLGLDPVNIRLEPHVPAANDIPAMRAERTGLKVHQKAWVHCIPGIAGYVGGDITAGVLAAGITLAEELTLFVDIGTNGEMVLGNKEWLVSCACSAGPAFEGSGLKYGMPAVRGAIEHLEIAPGGSQVNYVTVEDAPAAGICGSGLVESIAWLYRAGIIERNGKFKSGCSTSRIRDSESGKEFVLAWSEETGRLTDITISETEVKNLLRSKAAVYAGIRTMLEMVGLPIEAIKRVIIAGGFGRHISIRDAVYIGLLPDIPLGKYLYVGNSSITGAKMTLLSISAGKNIEDIIKKMTYLELSAGGNFMEEFISALFIPHTDLSLFPSHHNGQEINQ